MSLAPDAGVIDPGDIVSQTHRAMDYIGKILAEFGLGFEHVVKLNTFYCGEPGKDELMKNCQARFSRFTEQPGPVSTGVPVPYLAYQDMLIEIDLIAMA